VPEHIGNAGNTAMALVERVMRSLGTRNEPDIEPGGFIEGLELPYHEATRGTNQTQSRGSVQRRSADRASNPAPAVVTRTNSGSGIILPAPAVTMPLASRPRKGSNEVGTSEPITAESVAGKRPESVPQINANEVADKVYHLMQRDLILERERPNWGNKLW
jgi:hypothetical protein